MSEAKRKGPGKPRISESERSRVIALRFPLSWVSALKRLSKAKKISLAVLMRQAVQELLQRERQATK